VKRSEINQILRSAADFVESSGFHLPPFAAWTPEQCKTMRTAAPEVFELGLGWDLTDFGRGRFEKEGLVLFTLRNGSPEGRPYSKTYAEKILIIEPGQLTLTHCHWHKTEDIINRSGGTLVMKLHHATEDDQLAETPVRVVTDGVVRMLDPGGEIRLSPGESITLPPRLFHSFWADPEGGKVLAGEVSTVNDDRKDNCFYGEQLRYPEVEEDEAPWRLLVSDYRDVSELIT